MKRGQHVRIPWLHSVSVAELVIKLQFLYNSRQVPDSGLKIHLKQIFNIQDHLFPFCVKYFYLLQVMSLIVFRRFVINKGMWKICRRGEPHSALGLLRSLGIALKAPFSVTSLNSDLGFWIKQVSSPALNHPLTLRSLGEEEKNNFHTWIFVGNILLHRQNVIRQAGA